MTVTITRKTMRDGCITNEQVLNLFDELMPQNFKQLDHMAVYD